MNGMAVGHSISAQALLKISLSGDERTLSFLVVGAVGWIVSILLGLSMIIFIIFRKVKNKGKENPLSYALILLV